MTASPLKLHTMNMQASSWRPASAQVYTDVLTPNLVRRQSGRNLGLDASQFIAIQPIELVSNILLLLLLRVLLLLLLLLWLLLLLFLLLLLKQYYHTKGMD